MKKFYLEPYNMELLLKPEDCEIFGWIFEYATSVAWDEFQQNHTVDSRTERSFMSGVMEYALEVERERTCHVEFIHLLCLLADGEKTNLIYNGGDEHQTPLENALNNVDKLEESLDKKSPLRKGMAEMRRLIKIQAVLALLRVGETQMAEDLLAAFWPKQIKQAGADQEAVQTLTRMVGGNKNKAFDAAHSHHKFCEALLPMLKQIHDQFERPFLLKIVATKKGMEERRRLKHISCSQLKKTGGPKLWEEVLEASDKMVKEAKASTSQDDSSSSRNSPRHCKRTLTASSTSDEEWSPAKRGKSIRSLKYGQTSRTAPSTSKARTVEWESDEEEDSLITRLNGGKSVITPKMDFTLAQVPGKFRPRKNQKGGSPSKRKPWSKEEEEELILGINRFGVGRWAEISGAYTFNNRSNVQLKDKYRTMLAQGVLHSN